MTRYWLVLIALWLLIGVFVLLSWAVAFRLHYQLRSKNTALWTGLGRPSLLSSGRRLRRFLKHEGSPLEDVKLERLLRTRTAVRIGLGVSVLAFMVTVLIHG